MLNKKMLMALLPLALAGSMTVPGFAAEAIPAQQADLSLKPVVSDQNPLTRAELILALYEQEGTCGINFAMDYTDVSPDAEYAEAICWASSEGMVQGYGNGTFGPDDAVTREQMAVILYRYAQSSG